MVDSEVYVSKAGIRKERPGLAAIHPPVVEVPRHSWELYEGVTPGPRSVGSSNHCNDRIAHVVPV